MKGNQCYNRSMRLLFTDWGPSVINSMHDLYT
jgi:hypothetical protein